MTVSSCGTCISFVYFSSIQRPGDVSVTCMLGCALVRRLEQAKLDTDSIGTGLPHVHLMSGMLVVIQTCSVYHMKIQIELIFRCTVYVLMQFAILLTTILLYWEIFAEF